MKVILAGPYPEGTKEKFEGLLPEHTVIPVNDQKEYEEIAQIMDMSEQAARNLTYRAMEKIRKENNDFFVLLFMIALFSDYHF